ncbi:MAG: diguanylate cyclase [Maritimibacter sp.]|jgi:diguanylate cyclase (GGDEF)-like protein
MTIQTPISMAPGALDLMMPMHVVVDANDKIAHVGPTLAKVHPGRNLEGLNFFDVFELRRPRKVDGLAELCGKAGAKFYLRLRDPDSTPITASATGLAAEQGVLVNLSFGIAVIDAVARFNLAGSDFAATDLTLEMLYLVEAKSAAMEESRQLNERLHGAKAEAELQAMSDTLTGLNNRRALDVMTSRVLARGQPFTLMHLDLDFFKQVNDTLGHAAGDMVLKEVAKVLLDVTRGDDVVARVGGDEFVILFKGLTERKRLESIAGRLIERLEVPIAVDDGNKARISASIGMVTSRHYNDISIKQMMHDADVALYTSKDRGRAQYTMYSSELDALLAERLEDGSEAASR